MGRIFLDSNGITIKCENCVVGEKLMFNGEEFEVEGTLQNGIG